MRVGREEGVGGGGRSGGTAGGGRVAHSREDGEGGGSDVLPRSRVQEFLVERGLPVLSRGGPGGLGWKLSREVFVP